MKKFFFVVIFAIIAITTFAQDTWFSATSFAGRMYPNGQWSEWFVSDIPIVMNFATKHIEIWSETKQIIDFVELKEESFNGGKVYKTLATDTNYKTIGVQIFLYNSGSAYLKIIDYFKEIEYKYKLGEYVE